jgi:hypothetical protein
MSTRTIVQTFYFDSSKGNKVYETLLYDDKSTSCDCPGWCRRVQSDGSRSCKHTRLVEAGRAISACTNHRVRPAPPIPSGITAATAGGRKFL